MLDHSILHPTHTDADLAKECALADRYRVASVCVKPYMVATARRLLVDSPVRVGCVIGFPAGNSTIATKVFETTEACRNGATEIDMVINIARVLEGDWAYAATEIAAVTRAAHAGGALVKVIFETDYVTEQASIRRLCRICTDAGADFVKTSTGFGFSKDADGHYGYVGATLENLRLMVESVGPDVRVKASGAMRTLEKIQAARELGVSRIGVSGLENLLGPAPATAESGY